MLLGERGAASPTRSGWSVSCLQVAAWFELVSQSARVASHGQCEMLQRASLHLCEFRFVHWQFGFVRALFFLFETTWDAANPGLFLSATSISCQFLSIFFSSKPMSMHRIRFLMCGECFPRGQFIPKFFIDAQVATTTCGSRQHVIGCPRVLVGMPRIITALPQWTCPSKCAWWSSGPQHLELIFFHQFIGVKSAAEHSKQSDVLAYVLVVVWYFLSEVAHMCSSYAALIQWRERVCLPRMRVRLILFHLAKLRYTVEGQDRSELSSWSPFLDVHQHHPTG